MDYGTLVQQLIALEAQPRDRLLQRITGLNAQKAAYLDISARISGLLSRVQSLTQATSFRATTATSSLPDVLSVSTSGDAQAGSYQFIVRALATTHQFVTRGFADRTAPLSPGTLTIQSAQARVDRSTRLDELNGYTGVRRGSFKIFNAAGQQATVNIADALTIGEVVDKINAAAIGVTASVGDDGLVLTDTSTGSGTLRVQECNGGCTAADLGFGSDHSSDADADGELSGSSLVYLSGTMSLSALNDGVGVRRSLAGGDFVIQAGGTDIGVDLSGLLKPQTQLQQLNHGEGVRLGQVRITSKDGVMATVDLTSAHSISDIQTALNGAFGDGRLTVTLTGSRLVISDSTTAPTGGTTYNLKIEDITGHAAQDLGINGTETSSKINGRDILRVDTLADVIAAINHATANDDGAGSPLAVASINADGTGLVLHAADGGSLTLTEGEGLHGLRDLGFEAGTYSAQADGKRTLGGLNTVLLRSLNGGAGVGTGTIHIEANGNAADVDVTSAETLADVIDLINQASGDQNLGITASYDSTGTRLVIGNAGGGTNPITISDINGGTFAASVGLAQTGSTLRSNDLHKQYVSENTRLADLSNGRGVSFGSFKITNSLGVSETVSLTSGSAPTLRSVIDEINNLGIGVQAAINADGNGLEITDTTTGTASLKIEDQSGTLAHDLNIAGESADRHIDGSFQFQIEVSSGDTLDDLAERISGTTLAQATLLHDGSATTPYRLSISSRVGGLLGELVVNGGDAGLGVATLSRPQDARLLFGSGTDGGILLTSADNTFDDVVAGLNVTVSNVSDTPATVTVQDDNSAVLQNLRGLVTSFNDVISRMKDVSGYDQDTETKGVLLGDSTLRTVESRLYRMLNRYVTNAGGSLHRLSDIGLELDTGAQLTLDETKFQEACAADPEGVTRFFTDSTNGIAQTMKTELENITGTSGLIQSQTTEIDGNKEFLQERVGRLNDLLTRKQARLTRQFQAMESALAQLQSQQSALSSLQSTLSSYNTASSSSSSGSQST